MFRRCGDSEGLLMSTTWMLLFFSLCCSLVLPSVSGLLAATGCARQCRLTLFPSEVLHDHFNALNETDYSPQGACVYGCSCDKRDFQSEADGSCESLCRNGTGQTRFLADSQTYFVDFHRGLNGASDTFYLACMLGCRERQLCHSIENVLTPNQCKNDYCMNDIQQVYQSDCEEGCTCGGQYDDCLACCSDRVGGDMLFENSPSHRACLDSCLVVGRTPLRDPNDEGLLARSHLFLVDPRQPKDSQNRLVVNNGTVSAAFRSQQARIEQRREVYAVDPRRGAFAGPNESSIELQLSCESMNPDVYNNTVYDIRVLYQEGSGHLRDVTGGPFQGVLKQNKVKNITIDFDCTDFGLSEIVLSITLHPALPASHPVRGNYTTNVDVFFEKTCFASCQASSDLCGADTGKSKLAYCDTDDICQCPEGYRSDPDCRFGFFGDKEEYCPHEQVQLTWHWLTYGAATSDFVVVLSSNEQNAKRTFNGVLNDARINRHVFLDAYVTGARVVTDFESADNHGQFLVDLNSLETGMFTAGYFRDDDYDNLQAIVHFEVLEAQDSKCIASAENQALAGKPCDNGEFNANQDYCECDPGFFGLRCEYGCPEWGFESGSFGGSVEVRRFTNNQNCSWYVLPYAQVGFYLDYGLEFNVKTARLDGDDLFVKYGVDEGLKINVTERSLSETGASVRVPAPRDGGPYYVQIFFRSDAENPSWEQFDIGYFELTWRGTGCPVGFFVTALQVDAPHNVSCVPCEPGAYGTHMDAASCRPCPVGTFQPWQNASFCYSAVEECPEAFMYQDEEGQVGCKRCADNGFPEDWCEPDPRFSSAQTGMIIALCCIVGVTGLAFSVGIFYFRKTRVMMAGSLLFMYLTIAGVFVTLIGIVLAIGQQNSASCNARIWLFNIGLQLMFSPLLAKTYRLHRIFNNARLRATVISNRMLLGVVGAFLAVEVVILSVGLGFSPYRAEEPLRYICTADYRLLLLAAEGVVKGGSLVYGSVMAYNVRNIPTVYNESLHIAMAIGNILMSSASYTVLSSLNDHRETSVRYVSQLIAVYVLFSTMCILFGPKLSAVKRELDRKHAVVEDSNFADSSALPMQPRVQESPMERSNQIREFANALLGKDGREVGLEELQARLEKDIGQYNKLFKQRLALVQKMTNLEDKLCLMQHEFDYLCRSEHIDARGRSNTAQDNFFGSRKDYRERGKHLRQESKKELRDTEDQNIDLERIELEAVAE